MTQSSKLQNWIISEMEHDKPYLIKGKAIQAEIKQLIADDFGWPMFFLQFSKDMLSFTKHSITIHKSKPI